MTILSADTRVAKYEVVIRCRNLVFTEFLQYNEQPHAAKFLLSDRQQLRIDSTGVWLINYISHSKDMYSERFWPSHEVLTVCIKHLGKDDETIFEQINNDLNSL